MTILTRVRVLAQPEHTKSDIRFDLKRSNWHFDDAFLLNAITTRFEIAKSFVTAMTSYDTPTPDANRFRKKSFPTINATHTNEGVETNGQTNHNSQ